MGLANPENLSKQHADDSNLDSRITLHQQFSVNETPWHRWAFERMELASNVRVLEVGCGNAALWTENREKIPETARITLTDSSPGMLADARENMNLHFRNTLTQNFTFTSTDARSSPFAEGSFDAVVANHMLYHVPDRAKAVSEMARFLKPGGVSHAATNGRERLREVDGFIRRLDPEHSEHGLARNFSGFTLENGGGQLSGHFAEVSVSRREDELSVTEAGPLLAWALSTTTAREIAERIGEGEFRRRVSGLSETLEREISERGEIRVTKDAGLFTAKR